MTARLTAGIAAGAVAVAAGGTAAFDALLLSRVHAGSDNALRLSAVLPYLGIDSAYTLARSLGLMALIAAYVVLLLGLDLSTRRAGGRVPAAWEAATHRQSSLVTLALAAGHALWPYTSPVPPYGGWGTALVPFGQPSSWGPEATWWQTFGVVALYLGLLTGPSYYLFRRRARAWAQLHRLALIVYALAAAHAVLLGSDLLTRGWPRVGFLAAQVPVALALARRLWTGRPTLAARAAAWCCLAGAAALAGLAIVVADGVAVPGMRI